MYVYRYRYIDILLYYYIMTLYCNLIRYHNIILHCGDPIGLPQYNIYKASYFNTGRP